MLTGFLGSGKTTLLARLLKDPALRDTAVIVNELGEVGLDHQLVETVDQEVVLLPQGCLCCALDGDLAATLQSLDARRLARSVPEFRRVVVETTGLADPAPVLQTLLDPQILTLDFRLGTVVATVDAQQGGATLDAHVESVKQAAIADTIVLTKTDIAAPEAIAAIRGRLEALNPAAPVVEAVMGAVDPAVLFEAGGFDIATKTMDVRRWLAEPKGGHHRHHVHDDRIRTASFRFETPLHFAHFSDWLGRLVQQHGDRLLRVKGILDIEGQERPVVVHGVQHMYHPPVRLQAWPDADRSSRVVFIAQDLDRAFLEAELRRAGFEPL